MPRRSTDISVVARQPRVPARHGRDFAFPLPSPASPLQEHQGQEIKDDFYASLAVMEATRLKHRYAQQVIEAIYVEANEGFQETAASILAIKNVPMDQELSQYVGAFIGQQIPQLARSLRDLELAAEDNLIKAVERPIPRTPLPPPSPEPVREKPGFLRRLFGL